MNQKIRLIEKNDCLLSPFTKINLLLVLTRQKPATFITRNVSRSCPFRGTTSLNALFLKELKKFLVQLDIPHEIEVERPTNLNFVIAWIALKQEDLLRISAANKSSDDREMGRCFGYPKTAIEAYLGEREQLDEKIKLEELRDKHPLYGFSQFVLSRQFYKKEIRNTSMRWQETVKRSSPFLYAEAYNFSRLIYKDRLADTTKAD